MIEMMLNKIRIDEKSDGQVIVLKEKNGARELPIIIGILEVSAIKRNLSGLHSPRPMTHDLLASVIYQLGAKVEKVAIDKIENNTFHAKLVLVPNKNASRDKKILIDARPSDSIALAVRTGAPIFVEGKVLEDLKKHQEQLF